MPESHDRQLKKAADFIQKSRNAVAFTGAGISVPSGIPDFRSPGGLWSKYDPFRVASVQALDSNPAEVWQFLLETSSLLDKSQPNPAHRSLARLEELKLLRGVITQNIDNLHSRAGSELVIEYHGNFQRFYCSRCLAKVSLQTVRAATPETIPLFCPDCNGLIRPDVVFFGEAIPPRAHSRSQQLIQQADLMIIAGTSGEVAPANSLPNLMKRHSGTIIEINLGPTAYGQLSDIRFNAPVETVLPALLEIIEESSR